MPWGDINDGDDDLNVVSCGRSEDLLMESPEVAISVAAEFVDADASGEEEKEAVELSFLPKYFASSE